MEVVQTVQKSEGVYRKGVALNQEKKGIISMCNAQTQSRIVVTLAQTHFPPNPPNSNTKQLKWISAISSIRWKLTTFSYHICQLYTHLLACTKTITIESPFTLHVTKYQSSALMNRDPVTLKLKTAHAVSPSLQSCPLYKLPREGLP